MKDLINNERLKTESASMAKIKRCSLGVTALVLATSLAACGGGGSSGGGGEADEDSSSGFSVTAVTPADGESGVEPDAALTASFNKDLLASSIDSIELTKNNGVWPANVPVSTRIDTASSVNIQPDEPLDILSEYTVTMTSDFSDSSGSPLSEAFPWSFVTRDGDWEQAGLIDRGSAIAKGPGIAIDSAGNGWAVWLKEDLTTGYLDVIGRYYNAESGDWESQTLPLNSDDSSSASEARIAVDLEGNAIVAWIQDDAVYARYWDTGSAADESSWSVVEKISGSNPVHSHEYLSVEFHNRNGARAVWIEEDSAAPVLASNEYSAVDALWYGPQAGPELNPSFSSGVQRSVDFAAGQNDAIFLSLAEEPTLPEAKNRVYASRYDGDTRTWVSGITALEPGNVTGKASDPRIVFDKKGNAFAAWWRFSDGVFGQVYVSRYDADSGAWSRSTRIMGGREQDGGRFPSVAVDQEGNAIVSFEFGEPYAAHYDAGGDVWSDAQKIGDYAGAAQGNVAMDLDGNATVVWHKDEGAASNIFSNRYAAVTDSWGSEQRVETGGGGNAGVPLIDAYWTLSAITVWEDDGRIYANRFSPD